MATDAANTSNPDLPSWGPMANGDVGAQLNLRPNTSGWFTATGTFGAGGSVQLEGSNDGTNWFKLSPAALTAAGAFAALAANECPRYIRPHVTAGDGTTAITVIGNLFGGRLT